MTEKPKEKEKEKEKEKPEVVDILPRKVERARFPKTQQEGENDRRDPKTGRRR